MIRLKCPKCDRPWGVDNSLGGQIWTCPGCRSDIPVPADPAMSGSSPSDAPRRKHRPAAGKVSQPSGAPAASPLADVSNRRAAAGAQQDAHPGERDARTPPREELRLAEIASDPVIELEPVEEDESEPSYPERVRPEPSDRGASPVRTERDEEPPILAELDNDDDGMKTDLDEAPDVIFPPVVSQTRKAGAASVSRHSNHGFLLAGLALGVVALVTLVAGFLLSRGRAITNEPAHVSDPSYLALVEKGAGIETADNDPERRVVGVNMGGSIFKNTDIRLLMAFPGLRKLDLSDAPVTNFDLDQIAGLSALEELTLSGTKVSDQGMSTLKKLQNLRKLDLGRTIVTDGGLLELKGLTKLNELVLVGSLANGGKLKAALPHVKIRP